MRPAIASSKHRQSRHLGQQKLNRALIDLIQPLAKVAKVEVKSITTDSTDGVYGQLKENRKALEKQMGRYLNAILCRV